VGVIDLENLDRHQANTLARAHQLLLGGLAVSQVAKRTGVSHYVTLNLARGLTPSGSLPFRVLTWEFDEKVVCTPTHFQSLDAAWHFADQRLSHDPCSTRTPRLNEWDFTRSVFINVRAWLHHVLIMRRAAQ